MRAAFADLHERFQWLKQHERTKYLCPDYYVVSSTSSVRDGDLVETMHWEDRLMNVMTYREKTICVLYDRADTLGIQRDVMSTAVFIFDRYLSTFVPDYVCGKVQLFKNPLLGIASLFIAAKSLMSCEEIQPLVEYFGRYSRGVFADDTETKILMTLGWNIMYTSPISIVEDLLSLLPLHPNPNQQYRYQGYAYAVEAFKDDMLLVADYLTKLTSLRYGFNVNFPPSTIALAMLQIAFRECSFRHLPICKLIRPLQLLAAMFEQSDMSFSFADEDVKQCCHEMLHHMKGRSYENQNQKKKRDDTNISPATVTAEVHRSRRTIKKRNSFTAKTA